MQRMARMGFGTSFACVIFPLLAALGVSLRFLPDIAARDLNNPDSYMRLVRLRDMLDSHATLFAVSRDGSGHGTILHWSHLLDSLLYLLSLPFRLVLPQADALYAAALLFGPLNIAAAAFAACWAAAPFADRKWLFLGGLLAAISPAIASYGVAGVVHHHIAAVLAATMCWGWAARLIAGAAPPSVGIAPPAAGIAPPSAGVAPPSAGVAPPSAGFAPPAAGIALGAWAAVGIWFTPESVPVTAMGLAALGLAWIVSPHRPAIAQSLALAGASFAAITTLAWLADPPAEGLAAPDIDRLSALFAGMALAAAAIGAGLWLAHPFVRTIPARAAAASAIALTCAAAWAWVFRDALLRSNLAVPDEDWHVFFDFTMEMLPVANAWQAIHYLLTGGLAAALACVLAVRHRSALLDFAAICALALAAAGWKHVRFAAYPEIAGAIALPIALTLLHRASPAWPPIGQSLARIAVILLFFQVPYAVEVAGLTGTPDAAAPACKPAAAAAILASHPGAIVLTEANDTPELLYRTRIRTVGSLYHRNIPAFLRLRAAWRSPPSDTVPAAVSLTEASLILACASPRRSAVMEGLAGSGLLDQVRMNDPPAWLRRIAENPASGHVLYEIAR